MSQSEQYIDQPPRPGRFLTPIPDAPETSPTPESIEKIAPYVGDLIGFFDEKKQGSEAGGVITVTFDKGPVVGQIWEIERMVVATDSAAATELRVYFDSFDLRNLISGSSGGNFDTAVENPPIRWFHGHTLIFRWSNAPTAGSVGFVRIEGRIVKG